MEPSPKRQRLNTPATFSDHERSIGQSSNQSHNQIRSTFEGAGISHSNGNFNVARDVSIYNLSLQQSTATDPRRTLLDSLEFEQIDARHQSIRKEHVNTCRWFLSTEQYRQWEERWGSPQRENFLWIRGKPGAGKSTLMKFLLGQIKNRNRRKKSPGILISFFFNARGGELEKSTIGLYRSLLWQLLNSQPDLQTVLADSFRPGQQWTVELLQSLLEEAVQCLEERPTTCLIDALDECEEQQIRDMVKFLARLSKDSPLYICFASRHYPHISIATNLSIVLEERDGHQEDIATYLSSALQIGHSKLAEEIRSELKEKACGVFMWVVLVVDILNKEYDAGRKHRLRERLQQLPGDLDALFRDILTRDTRNQEGLLLCIQWVLFAAQPLTPKELYLGIMAGIEPEYLPDCHSSETYSDDDIRKYILNNSKGLAESTKSKKPTVQFIHESVRDFLLKEDGLSKVFPNLGPNVLGYSHEALKSCCLRYMRMEALVAIGDSSREAAITTYPLLEYANRGILYHADRAGDNGVRQHSFLDDFPRPAWVQHYNMLQKYGVRRYTSNVSLLYILAEAGMPALVRAYANRQSCFDVEDERYGLPILAASAVKGAAAVQAMLEAEAHRVPGFSFGDFCTELLSSVELSNAPSRNFRFKKERNLLHQLIDYGDEFISLFFLKTRLSDELQGRSGADVLIKAAQRDFSILFKQLIDHGADISAADKDGYDLLYLASINGMVERAKLLINHGIDVNTQGGSYGNALQAASLNGHQEIVQLLLDNGPTLTPRAGNTATLYRPLY
ncbi:hypothetical protein PFICI_11048 [Pestalotiopsis fici W106-1]|uniref:NACHT domain-containing protein n=1 Tax=Pestalotiopsis fici (strain W106-1 / CGMCC3.15140) TaxID=1229662 RepID=W3WTN7_PESFW|nr:uncharacterized protein PFICI_11048 [Pestalotiopsis fici W106-1]ETS77174.1 hypothetical protein PFICI_11048 [Pestalotiopsis fici W106-1]